MTENMEICPPAHLKLIKSCLFILYTKQSFKKKKFCKKDTLLNLETTWNIKLKKIGKFTTVVKKHAVVWRAIRYIG